MSFLFKINEDGLVQLFSNWLDIQSLSIIDEAITNHLERPIWLMCLKAINTAVFDTYFQTPSSVKWLIQREIAVSCIKINPFCRIDLILDPFEGLNTSSLRMINLSGNGLPDGALASLALTCPNLQTVDLAWYRGCVDMTTFAQGCPRLETINLKYCYPADSTDYFKPLAEYCPQLKSITICEDSFLDDMGLAALAGGCRSLRCIKMQNDRLYPTFPLDRLSPRCRMGMFFEENDLKKGYPFPCQVTDEGVVTLAEGCPQLEVIDLNFCKKITSVSIAAIGARCSFLRSINIGSIHFIYRDESISALAHGCPLLESITVNRYVRNTGLYRDQIVTDKGMSVLARCCPMLQTMILDGFELITDVSIQAIAQGCPLLKIFYALHSRNLTGASLVALGRGCPLLEGAGFSTEAEFKDTDLRFFFTECPKLRIVDYKMDAINQQLIANGCPSLQHVSLISDAHCAQIGGGCHKVVIVETYGAVTDVGIEAIARGCPLLADLRLDGCGSLTDKSISILAQCCRNLHTISLTDFHLLTDTSLQVIALGCPLLVTIVVRGCVSMSEKGVNTLIRSCPRLRYLEFSDCDLKKEKIKNRPNLCSVIRNDYYSSQEYQEEEFDEEYYEEYGIEYDEENGQE